LFFSKETVQNSHVFVVANEKIETPFSPGVSSATLSSLDKEKAPLWVAQVHDALRDVPCKSAGIQQSELAIKVSKINSL
jgi:hypothetical protein